MWERMKGKWTRKKTVYYALKTGRKRKEKQEV